MQLRKNGRGRYAHTCETVLTLYLLEKGKCRTQYLVSLHLYRHMKYMKGFWQKAQKRITVIAFGERNRLTNGLEWKSVME